MPIANEMGSLELKQLVNPVSNIPRYDEVTAHDKDETEEKHKTYNLPIY